MGAQPTSSEFHFEHFHCCSSKSFPVSVIFRGEECETTRGAFWRVPEPRSVLSTTLIHGKHPTRLHPACKAPQTHTHQPLQVYAWAIPEPGPQTLRGCGISHLVSPWKFPFPPFFTQTCIQSQLRHHFFQKPFPDSYQLSLPFLLPPPRLWPQPTLTSAFDPRYMSKCK